MTSFDVVWWRRNFAQYVWLCWAEVVDHKCWRNFPKISSIGGERAKNTKKRHMTSFDVVWKNQLTSDNVGTIKRHNGTVGPSHQKNFFSNPTIWRWVMRGAKNGTKKKALQSLNGHCRGWSMLRIQTQSWIAPEQFSRFARKFKFFRNNLEGFKSGLRDCGRTAFEVFIYK